MADTLEKLYTSQDLAHWYALGVQHEQERAAGAEHEHAQALTVLLGERVAGTRKAELMRVFRRKAEEVAESMGRTYREYRGGPVEVWS